MNRTSASTRYGGWRNLDPIQEVTNFLTCGAYRQIRRGSEALRLRRAYAAQVKRVEAERVRRYAAIGVTPRDILTPAGQS